MNSNSLITEQKNKQKSNQTNIYMKIEFKKSNVRLSLLCNMTGIKIAWVNPWYVGYKERGTILKKFPFAST